MSSGLENVLVQLFRYFALKMFNKMHPHCNNNLSDPPGEPFPSVSISVAILHLHQLGEKGPVPNHLGNLVVIAVIVIIIIIFLIIALSQNYLGNQTISCLSRLILGYRDQSNSTITTYHDKQP